SYFVDGNDPEAESLWMNGGSLYDFYETKDGKYISVGSIEPRFFSAFCIAIDRPDLIKGGIEPGNVKEVKRQICEIIKSKTRDQWTDIFEKIDACVEPVLAFSEAIDSQYARERGVVVELDVPNAGKIRQIANPIKFSEDTLEYRWAGCAAGTHLKEVLAGLNYSEDEINGLQKEGVFD
ncbi:MAG TPA: CoA transferase, partial [Syntrophales bacterium]